MKPEFKGIICPIVTPFDTKGNVNVDALKHHVRRLAKSGLSGIFALGTTGEFPLLNSQERLAVIRTVVEAKGALPAIAGVSDAGTDLAVGHAVNAERLGVEALAATPPYYFRPTGRGVVAHFRRIASSVSVPLLLYNIPAYTGLQLRPETLSQLDKIKGVAAMKYTTSDLSAFAVALRAFRKPVLIGSDILVFSALALGAAGAVAGAANVAPRRFCELYERFVRGDLEGARELQEQLNPLILALNAGTYPAGVKEALGLMGVDVGGVRRPLRPLTAEEKATLRRTLRELGLV